MTSKHLPGARVTVASLSFSGRVVIKRDEAPEQAERSSACWVLLFVFCFSFVSFACC